MHFGRVLPQARGHHVLGLFDRDAVNVVDLFTHGVVAPAVRLSGLGEGIAGIKNGERRFLVLPTALAFGDAGIPPRIPPYQTMLVDVECVEIK